MKSDIYKFQKDLKIRFKKKSLLIKALTHKSADQENNNEKTPGEINKIPRNNK